MQVPRVHNWQSRLSAVIAARKDVPFAWGEQDCCTFAGASVHAVTDLDRLQAFGRWSTAEGAARILKKAGGLRAAVTAQLGAEIPVLMAQAGDVGMFDEDGRDTLAVWAGSNWLCPGRRGLAIVQASAIVTAWRCCGVAS